MGPLFSQWTHYIEINGGATGLVLVAFGACFLGLGWRFERIALSAVYGLLGVVWGFYFGTGQPYVLVLVGGCATVGLVLGAILGRLSASVLSGLLGAVAAWTILDSYRIPATTFYVIVGLAFAAAMAVAVTRHREATIVGTSFVGAVLLVSGLIAMVSQSRTLLPHYRSLAEMGIFFPFVLAVATVSGVLLQLAASNRSDSGDIKV